jgi:hypothetical protein
MRCRGPNCATYRVWPSSSRPSAAHNAFVVQFSDERRAIGFERYLKAGSGCAFTQRHFR